MKDKPRTIPLTEIVPIEKLNELVDYVNAHPNSYVRDSIIDWLGTQPEILKTMNERQLLLTYFAYVLEHALNQNRKEVVGE